MPITGGLFFAGILGLLGLPPFGLFVSEVLLIRAGFAAGYPRLTAFILALVLLIFVSLLGHVSRMLYGPPPGEVRRGDLPAARFVPIAFALAVLVILGLVIPGPLAALLRGAVEVVYG
jgi:hydrogenase-4 component F